MSEGERVLEESLTQLNEYVQDKLEEAS